MIPTACWLSFATGFISLSAEILWVRLFAFSNHSLPQAFAFVLTSYLIGIGLGARIGQRFCEQNRDLWKVSGHVLLVSAWVDLASPWIYAEFARTGFQVPLAGVLIALTALFKAIVFPMAHQLGTPEAGPSVGRSISKVYVFNIAGATLGPLMTGLIFLQAMTTQACFMFLAALSAIAGAICLGKKMTTAWRVCGIGVAAALIALWKIPDASALIAKTCEMPPLGEPNGTIRRIIENRYGIVTTYHGGEKGDLIYGANVYDGRTNLDPVLNSNRIDRVLVLQALHERPKRILVVGLSIGSWTKLAMGFPGVESVDAVEINPGYVEAMKDYPAQASILSDPRMRLYIDDGRRWLRNHPDERYDLIIMNTSYYWRAYGTNLLSKEFMQIIRKHLNPGGVLTFNTTWSPDVYKTAASVFPFAFARNNFMIAAEFDWREKLKDPKALERLLSIQIDGKPLFPPGKRAAAESVIHEKVIPLEVVERFLWNQEQRQPEIITDINLITEYKHGERLGGKH